MKHSNLINNLRVFFTLAIAGAICLIGLAAQHAQAQQNQPQGLPVKAAPVKLGTVTNEVSAVGTLIANESVILRPEITGRISGIHFREGEAVGANAKLVTLDSEEYQARLWGSTSEVNLYNQRYERAGDLFRKGFISQQALDDARENFAQASARKRENEVRLSKTEIRAPFSGIVGLRQVSVGAYVQPGQDIARLEDIGSLKLDFRVPEVYLAKITKDQEVIIRVDAYPQQKFTGRVYALEPAVDLQTRTVSARARVPNPGGKLRPGMFVRVSLVLESRANALLIPEQAIVPKGQDSFVFRVVDGRAQLTRVELGQRNPGQVEIMNGLAADDIVVTDGQIKLQDGTPVMVLPENTK